MFFCFRPFPRSAYAGTPIARRTNDLPAPLSLICTTETRSLFYLLETSILRFGFKEVSFVRFFAIVAYLGLGRVGVEVVRLVDPHTIHNADSKGVGRTMEGTTHTPDALFTKGKLAALDLDVVHGTTSFTLTAMHALLLVHLKEPAAEAHPRTLHFANAAGKQGAEGPLDKALFPAGDDFRVFFDALFHRKIHLCGKGVLMTEDHIVRHHVMKFPFDRVAFAL